MQTCPFQLTNPGAVRIRCLYFPTIFCAPDWSHCVKTSTCTLLYGTKFQVLGVCPLCTLSFYVTAREHTSLYRFMLWHTLLYEIRISLNQCTLFREDTNACIYWHKCEMYDAVVCNACKCQLALEGALWFAVCNAMCNAVCKAVCNTMCKAVGKEGGGQWALGQWPVDSGQTMTS